MHVEPGGIRSGRQTLSRERVLSAALAVADEGGLAALTIRSVASVLDAKPMSLYYYVANKGEILDGIVDLVFAEIELPSAGGEWRSELRRRSLSVLNALRRHPWAIGLLESRSSPGPASLRHHDATIGVLRAAGFSVPMTAHIYAMVDSYVYGFAMQEAALPFKGPESMEGLAASIMDGFSSGQYPHFVELVTEHVLQPGYDFADEFAFGLDVILDALDPAR